MRRTLLVSVFFVATGLVIVLFVATGLLQARTLATFTMKERFGVSHPDQPVEFSYSGGRLDPSGTRMLGPGGQEVPYQQLSTGNVLIRTPLPASRVATAYAPQINAKAGTITINLNMLGGASPATGEVVRYEGPNVPGGLVVGRNYFLKKLSGSDYQLATRKDLSDTVGLAYTQGFVIRRQGWIVDPDDPGRRIYAKAHPYRTGDPIWLKSSGSIPAPLVAEHLYFVIKSNDDTFRLAVSLRDAMSGVAVNLTTLGSGIFETSVQWTWTLVSGHSPSASLANPVLLTDRRTVYEATNGLTGVRVAKPAGSPGPFDKAPIQGIRLADNSWSATGPNLLYQADSQQPVSFVTSYSVAVVESGPLLVRLRANYVLKRPEYTYGSGLGNFIVDASSKAGTVALAGNQSYWNGSTSMQFHRNGGTLPCGLVENKLYWPLTRAYDHASNRTTFTLSASKGGDPMEITCAQTGRPDAQETMNLAGAGYFSETISLYAGHQSIVVEDDTDSQIQYFLNFYNRTFVPDQARYRGHAATSLDCGYSLNGSVRSAYLPYTDAFLDLSYGSPKDSSYVCDANHVKFAPIWYLASTGSNTGWYWEFYNSAGSPSSPLIGYYLGRTSQYVTSLFAGPGVYTSPSHFAANQAPAAGITMSVALRGTDGRSTQRTRREWALYIGTNADLRDSTQPQPIAIERNVMAGINLTRLQTYVFDYPDPAGGWPPPYQDRASYDRFVQRFQTDPAFVSHVNNVAPELRDLVSMWRGNTTEDIELVVSHLEQFAFHWQNVLVNKDGIFDSWWHYYQPGLIWGPLLTRTMAVLNSSIATPLQRERTKAVAAFAASVFWDDDYVPWDADTGDGTGNANQGDQYSLYRAQNALMLFTQPLMKRNLATARQYAESIYSSYLNPVSGVPRGSTHYQGAAMDPALSNFLELKNAGTDMGLYPKWEGFGRWLIGALTPPDPRFGNIRKMVSVGDGNTEATAMHGMVATLLRSSAPLLSSQLQWSWLSQNTSTNQTYGEFSAPSMLVIDPNAHASAPELRSGDYPGYWSMLRHGFATPHETAVWFVNGDFYSDHRHNDDGQVTIYAHSAPLAIDWNPNLYYPHVSGGFQHNRVVRESEIGQAWNADNPSLDAGTNWGTAQQTAFSSFANSSDAETAFVASDGTAWTRRVTTIAPDLQYPVIYIRDHFTGAGAASSKVLTWNLMAHGSVDTPAGQYTPIPRLNTSGSSKPNALPSNGPDYALLSGPQHFLFTGQNWAAHATKGIDWDLYLVPDGPQSFYIGSWGHNMHAGREMGEYLATNGSTFQESQYILRVRGTGSFATVILPYRKGEALARTVTEEPCGIHISQPQETTCISESWYQWAGRSGKILTTFDARPAHFDDISVTGGPTEVILGAEAATITASGLGGARLITLAGNWSIPAGVTKNGSTYRLDYQGGGPITVVLKRD